MVGSPPPELPLAPGGSPDTTETCFLFWQTLVFMANGIQGAGPDLTPATFQQGLWKWLVVDLGYGASPVTTLELYRVVKAIAPDAEVTGLEIDQDRVASARR